MTEDELITAAIDYAKSDAPGWQNARHWRVGFARAACEALLAKLEDERLALPVVVDPREDAS